MIGRLLPAFLLLFLSGFACSPMTPSKDLGSHPCSQVALQNDSWSPQQTRAVVACLLSVDSQSAQQVLRLDSRNFENIGLYLNQAFRDQEIRQKLLLQLKTTKENLAFIEKALAEPLLQKSLQSTKLPPALPWLKTSFRSFDIVPWLEQMNALELSAQDLQSLFEEFQNLLHGINQEFLNTPELYKIAFEHLKNIAFSPTTYAALQKLDLEHYCSQVHQTASLTQSPVQQTLKFFHEDRERPLHFINSAQQAFSYWSQVCNAPTGLQLHELPLVLDWVLSHWSSLQNFFSVPETHPLVSPATQLLQKSWALRISPEEHPLSWMFSHGWISSLVADLSTQPEALQEWIQNFGSILELLKDLEQTPLQFSQNLMSAWPSSLSSDIQSFLILSDPFLLEILNLVHQIDDSNYTKIRLLIRSGTALEILNFVEWMLQEQGTRLEETRYSHQEKTLIHSSKSSVSLELSQNLSAAQELVERCLHRSTLKLIESCLENENLPRPPEFAKAFWQLKSDSKLLFLAQDPSLEFFSTPEIGKSFWIPALKWIQSSRWPLAATLKQSSFFIRITEAFPHIHWNSALDKTYTHFRNESLTESAHPSVQRYRSLRSQDIRSDIYEDKELRAFLLDPNFFKKALNWLHHPSSLETRRSIQRIYKARIESSLWIENRKQKVEMDPAEALDILFWELQIPLLSSHRSIRSTIESWDKIQNTADMRAWLESKSTLLNLARKAVKPFSTDLFQRLDNAHTLIELILSKRALHQDFLKASRILRLFKNSQNQYSIGSAKSLLALQQLGFTSVLKTLLVAEAHSDQNKHHLPFKIQTISDTSLQVLSQHLQNFLAQTPAKILERWARQQMQSDVWFLRSVASAFATVYFQESEVIEVINQRPQLVTHFLNQSYHQIFREWSFRNLHLSETEWNKQVSLFRDLVGAMEHKPQVSWFYLAQSLNSESSTQELLRKIPHLKSQDFDALEHWLNSGIPHRLMQWNRSLKAQIPDSNNSHE
jgi:hypothetical protein